MSELRGTTNKTYACDLLNISDMHLELLAERMPANQKAVVGMIAESKKWLGLHVIREAGVEAIKNRYSDGSYKEIAIAGFINGSSSAGGLLMAVAASRGETFKTPQNYNGLPVDTEPVPDPDASLPNDLIAHSGRGILLPMDYPAWFDACLTLLARQQGYTDDMASFATRVAKTLYYSKVEEVTEPDGVTYIMGKEEMYMAHYLSGFAEVVLTFERDASVSAVEQIWGEQAWDEPSKAEWDSKRG